jgi:hypothetical protein
MYLSEGRIMTNSDVSVRFVLSYLFYLRLGSSVDDIKRETTTNGGEAEDGRNALAMMMLSFSSPTARRRPNNDHAFL